MADTETEPRAIDAAKLRGLIVDSDELKKGTEIFDRKGVTSLARFENKLFGEVKGSGQTPYKVSLAFGESSAEITASCTCKAARTRAVCKHAAALLVAWMREPGAFVMGAAPPVAKAAAQQRKKSVKSVKAGKVDDHDLMTTGVTHVETLVRELGTAGVTTASAELVAQVRKLAESLRAHKLRRLSARALELAELLGPVASDKAAPPAAAYADLLADLLMTARKLQKHLGGEPLDDRHVEELVGKSWREADRRPQSGLDLIEVAYRTWLTSDDFIIRESRFVDIASGAHYTEKQIIPSKRDRFTEPKPSRAGEVLAGASGSAFPGYAPLRLKIDDLGARRPLDEAAIVALVDKALPEVGAALAAFQEHRRDVFAPESLPVAVRVDTLLARGQRMEAVDKAGQALLLPQDPALEDRLGTALHAAALVALVGDVGLEAALPTLRPLAAVIRGARGLELRPLIDPLVNALATRPAAPETGSTAWAQAAREAGASALAIALGEAREELAEALTLGLAALGPRVADPIAARLDDMGLSKPAALLRSICEESEAEERIDDFIKLYQVLGVALVRLAGATEVDRGALTRVPTYESVFIEKPAAWLDPREVEARRAAGSMNRYEAAAHYARYYEGLEPAALVANIYPIWADGGAAPYVVRAFAGRRPEAVAAAKKALEAKSGRVAKITAIRVLEAAGGLEAETIIFELATSGRDVGLRALAAEARDALELRRGRGESVARRKAESAARLRELVGALLHNPHAATRSAAVHALVQMGNVAATPAIRQAFFCDQAYSVRSEAAVALGMLGDTSMVDAFVHMLEGRKKRPADASLAIRALGHMGDVRALPALLDAFVEGFDTQLVAQALRQLGPAALDALLVHIEAHPEIAERSWSNNVLSDIPDQELADAIVARLEARPKDASFPDAASVYLKVAAVHPHTKRVVAKAILGMIPEAESGAAVERAVRKSLL